LKAAGAAPSALRPPLPPPFPWDRALAVGFGILRLSPENFWALTPRELAAAMRGLFGEPAAIDRTAFDDLMRRFPDRRKI